MRKRTGYGLVLTPLVAAILALQGCGGGGGGSDAPATSAGGGGTPGTNQGTYQLTGTVPGTLIEAFCEDGTYYKTTSLDNGTTAHPFSLTLPNGTACQVVMTMNELDPDNATISPIIYRTPAGQAIALKGASSTVDLGYVPLPDARRGEVSLIDKDGNGVIDTYERLTSPLEVDLDHPGVEVVPASVTLRIDPDHDGIPSYYDDDDDNDGRKDWDDDDDDNDGIRDIEERDSDHDGIDDDYDRDRDNNGVYDDRDAKYIGDSQAGTSVSLLRSPAVTFNLPSSYVPDLTGGRLMASQCAQCHGTNGYSVSGFEGLAGEADEIIEEIMEYHYKPNYDIMAAQAKTYSAEEAQKMQSFFMNMARQYGGGEYGYDDDRDRYDDNNRYDDRDDD